MPTTGERLYKFRKALGLTQGEAAKCMGMDGSQISEYERGVQGPRLDTVVHIADIYGLSLDWLTGRKATGGVDPCCARTFGQRLKEARKARGLSQDELAWRSGLTPATLSGWECDHANPTLALTLLVADVLDVSLDWLAGREGHQMPKIDIAALLQIKDARPHMTGGQYKTLRGQVLAGDTQGALKDLQKILLLNGSNAIKNH